MIEGFLNLPWFLWAALALILAFIWIYVGPHTKIPASPSLRFFIIHWGHALTWLLLAVNFLLRGIDPGWNGIANMVAAGGGLMYVLFMLMTFIVK